MGDKLKPCPNCGEKPPVAYERRGNVVCDPVKGGCGMNVYDQTDIFSDIAAARLWNALPRKRKAARPKRKAVEAAVDAVIRAAQTEGHEEGARGTSFTFFSFINPGVTRRARADLLALLGYGPKGGDA